MAIPFATTSSFLRAVPPTRPEGMLGGFIDAQKRARLARGQNLINQVAAARLAGIPAKQKAQALLNRMNQMKLQQQPQAFQALLALKQQQQDLARQQAGLIPARQKLLGAQTAQAKSKSLFTPKTASDQALAVQKLKNEAALVAQKAKAKATSPFEQHQATQLSSDLKGVSADASVGASNTTLYTKLNTDLNNLSLTGPMGSISWTTPAGQKFIADLVRAQGEFIKSFHLGRMTQIEFNFLKKAIGKKTTYASTLRKLFADQLSHAKNSINKLSYYHNYISKGGRDPEKVSLDWIHQQHPETGATDSQNKTYSEADLEYTAKQHGMTVDQVKTKLGMQ